jgi:hypothetical protein
VQQVLVLLELPVALLVSLEKPKVSSVQISVKE